MGEWHTLITWKIIDETRSAGFHVKFALKKGKGIGFRMAVGGRGGGRGGGARDVGYKLLVFLRRTCNFNIAK